MIFPAQLQNFTYLQRRDFSLVYDRSASGGTPLVTSQVCLWSPSTFPHPRAEPQKNSQAEAIHASVQSFW